MRGDLPATHRIFLDHFGGRLLALEGDSEVVVDMQEPDAGLRVRVRGAVIMTPLSSFTGG